MTIKKTLTHKHSLTPIEIKEACRNLNTNGLSNEGKQFKAYQFIANNVELLDSTKAYGVISSSKGNLNTGYIAELITAKLYGIDKITASKRGENDITLNGLKCEIKSILNPSSPSASLNNEVNRVDMFIGLTLNGIYEITPTEILKHLSDRKAVKVETDGRIRAKAYMFEQYGKRNNELSSKLVLND